MKRSLVSVALCIALVGVVAVPAFAGVDSSPNVGELVNVSCPEAGLSFETIWIGSESSVAGHDLEGNTVGVAKSLYMTDSEGNPLVGLFDRPGKGLDNITVWCFWPDDEVPSGFAGGDILFKAQLRT